MAGQNNNSRDIVLYKTLISLCHKAGLVGVTTELLQLPADDNGGVAIFRATVTMEQDGRTKLYQGTGDASVKNVNPMVAHCFIRMAETRAIARAMRIAVDAGDVADVELSEYDEAHQSPAPAPAPRPVRRPAADLDGPATDIQRAAIENLSRKRGEVVPDGLDVLTRRVAGEWIQRLQQRVA